GRPRGARRAPRRGAARRDRPREGLALDGGGAAPRRRQDGGSTLAAPARARHAREPRRRLRVRTAMGLARRRLPEPARLLPDSRRDRGADDPRRPRTPRGRGGGRGPPRRPPEDLTADPA